MIQDKESIGNFTCFMLDEDCIYYSFCEDFGPMNLGCVFTFCESLDSRLKTQPPRPLALITDLDKRNITNAAFLLGAYMIMRLDAQPQEVTAAFAPLHSSLVSFRDVSPGEQNFHLYLRDCWEGLWRARQAGLVDLSAAGSFDAEEYAELDNPLNADLHGGAG